MIIVTVENIRSQLSGYADKLDEHLSCFHPGYFFSPKYKRGLWDGKTHFLKIPSLQFPTGLLFMVEEFFGLNGVEYEICDQRKRPSADVDLRRMYRDIILSDIALRDYQVKAVNNALLAGQGVLELPTGSGKTEIAAALIKLINSETLFLVHTQDLLRQTKKRFEERMQIGIGCIGDNQYDVENRKVVVATIQSLYSRLDREEKKTKDFLNTFNVLFLDECHHASAVSWYRIGLLCRNAYYRFGLSGSILRRDVLSNVKMLALFGKPICRLPATELIGQGYLSNVSVKLVKNEEAVPVNKGAKWAEVYDLGVVHSRSRNEQIIAIAERHFRERKRVMVLIRKIEHGEILEAMLRERSIPVVFLSGRDSSETRESIKETYNDKVDTFVFVLIASTIFNEGVDMPEVNVIIVAAGGKSEVQTIQRVGRGLRPKNFSNELILYDFVDSGKFLGKHSRARIATYKKEGFLKEEGCGP